MNQVAVVGVVGGDVALCGVGVGAGGAGVIVGGAVLCCCVVAVGGDGVVVVVVVVLAFPGRHRRRHRRRHRLVRSHTTNSKSQLWQRE